jgi:hypothetical protein
LQQQQDQGCGTRVKTTKHGELQCDVRSTLGKG